MENNSLNINAVCFGILCNFTPICGKERAEEAAGLVRSLQVDNDRLLDGVNKFNWLDADIWADWQPPYCPNCSAKMDKE